MKKTASIVFPNTLFENNPSFEGASKIFIWEANLYFDQFKFHKQKLVLHRASMKFYQDFISKTMECEYLDNDKFPSLKSVFEFLQDYDEINYTDTNDFLLEKRLKRYSNEFNIKLNKYLSPNFLTNEEDFSSLIGNNYFMANFYKKQRKKLDILMYDGEPVGGKWSYDEDNRKKLPKNISIPRIDLLTPNKYVVEAKNYIENNFSNNYGLINSFNYPTTFTEAKKALNDFLEKRFLLFGDYEDAISKNEVFLFHSILTPALNIGLLNPDFVVKRAIEFAAENDIPLNSLEGFLRQIIGWREFMRIVYLREGVKQRNSNSWSFHRTIPESFWIGNTGIEPVDDSIKKVLEHSYVHHIERLMVLGNIMMLCEFHPNEVYNWFMELFIDSYDWVMVPNVYGMSQNADNGLITTKPYISGSNYIRKMSNYKKGDWCEIWDALYWRFIYKYKDRFLANHRMSMMGRMVEKMDSNKLNKHLEVAENYLENLH